ncbi:MAG: DUF2062 domain-containing protein [Polaromonas sp.]|uniref:DUF2062 domain-containing protein n=1 Tax=Polaromonas sp. TaxID=1869339 RepID=UPI0027346A9D|nr:DUF2062 domain-containing protein [Polaromonas sp.]MDP3796159.1 DUF2062 domain-containing protein [Polaromonas sp.]
MSAQKSTAPRRTGWTGRLRALLPTRETLSAHPWLKPVAHRLLDPQLWRPHHESVARGVAIGIFWAFAIPFAQFFVAAAHSVWWRANIPVAAGVTLITNPFTIGFWLWLAYQVGRPLLDAPPPPTVAEGAGVVAWLTSFGAPAILGMGIFAVVGSITSYMLVKLVWRLRIWFKRRHR